MARRVKIGCPNCISCTNSRVAESWRKAGRLLMPKLLRRRCRACGHPMSIHH